CCRVGSCSPNNADSQFVWNYTPTWGGMGNNGTTCSATNNNGTLCSAWEGYGPPSASSALTWLNQTYRYDALGRVSSSAQTTNGKTYLFSYKYNLAGALTSETYPSGRVV